LRVDPGQRVNLYGDPKYSDTIKELDTKLTEFFNKYADPKYDLWKGGSGKAFVVREAMWKATTGPSWHIIAGDGKTVPKFTEAGSTNDNSLIPSANLTTIPPANIGLD
jgi:hypothetical protein